MDYRVNLAARMLANKRGSLIGAVLAVSIGILVIHVNFVIFQGIYDAIIRDMTDYRFGDIFVSHEEEATIERSHVVYTNWFERVPLVQSATPRLTGSADIEFRSMGEFREEFDVPVVGVEPVSDIQASKIHTTISDGQYVYARNSIVVGETVAQDLGGVRVGDNLKLIMTDQGGDENSKRFVVTGISKTAGGQGFDTSVIVHIDTLRSLVDRPNESNSIFVKLNEKNPDAALEIRKQFLAAYANDDLKAQTIEEAAEQTLKGFRSGIAMINLIGYFGMGSSAFAIVTIQMMLVNSKTREIGVSKTREIGVMRAIGAKRKDILMVFILQGMIIGAIGAGAGTGIGLAYTTYAKETNMQFQGSLALEVNYNWSKIAETALLAFFLAILAAIYPSYRATKLQPVEAMRNV